MLNRISCQKLESSLIIYIPFALFYGSSVFDPSGLIFNLRDVSVSLMFVLLLLQIFFYNLHSSVDVRYLIYQLAFSVFLPVYGLVVAAFRGGLREDFIDTSYIASGLYLFLSIAIYFNNNSTVACRMFLLVSRLLSFLMIVVFFAKLINAFPDFVYGFVLMDLAFIGDREYGGVTFPYIYFITSPVLVFLVAYDAWIFYEKKSVTSILFLCVSVSALFVSGTRAAMLISITTPVLVLLWKVVGRFSVLLSGFLCFFLVGVLLLSGNSIMSDMVNTESGSNQEKIGYIDDYVEILSEPSIFFFGQGYNAHVWSPPVKNIVSEGASKSELTYLELVRVFGFPVALLVICLIFYLPFSRGVNHNSFLWIKPAFLMYILMVSVNPYFFSLNGMAVFGITLAIIFGVNNSNFVNSGKA